MTYDDFTYDEFDANYDTDMLLQDSHAEYIMENCQGERNIGNGDMLIEAMESGYLYEEFRDYYIKENS